MTPDGEIWLEPVTEVEGFWVELDGDMTQAATSAARVLPALAAILEAERIADSSRKS